MTTFNDTSKKCEICFALFTRGRVAYTQWNKSRFCSRACKGKHHSKMLLGIRNPNWRNIDRKCADCDAEISNPEKTTRCRSCYRVFFRGANTPNWQGGKTSKSLEFRSRQEYKDWRLKVFTRDGFKCIECGDSRGGNLQADHIKPYALFPDLRLDITNGRTLCQPCHRKTPTWGAGALKYKEPICH